MPRRLSESPRAAQTRKATMKQRENDAQHQVGARGRSRGQLNRSEEQQRSIRKQSRLARRQDQVGDVEAGLWRVEPERRVRPGLEPEPNTQAPRKPMARKTIPRTRARLMEMTRPPATAAHRAHVAQLVVNASASSVRSDLIR